MNRLEQHLMSGWLRQLKWRARKTNPDLECDVTFNQLVDHLNTYDDKCSFCEEPVTAAHLAFPLSEGGPLILSNMIPVCHACSVKTKNTDVITYYKNGHITTERLDQIIKGMVKRDQTGQTKSYIRNYVKGCND